MQSSTPPGWPPSDHKFFLREEYLDGLPGCLQAMGSYKKDSKGSDFEINS